MSEKLSQSFLRFLRQSKRDGFVYVDIKTCVALEGLDGSREITDSVKRIDDLFVQYRSKK